MSGSAAVPAPAARRCPGSALRAWAGSAPGGERRPGRPRGAHSPARGHEKGERAAMVPSSEENGVVHSPAAPEGRAGAEEEAIQAPQQRSVSWTGAPQRSQQFPQVSPMR